MRSEHRNRNCSDKYCELVMQAFSAFGNQVNLLLTGCVTVRVLNLILQHPDAFIEVCNTFKLNLKENIQNVDWTEATMTDHLKRVLAQRKHELEVYQRHCKLAGEFRALCMDMEGVRRVSVCYISSVNRCNSLLK